MAVPDALLKRRKQLAATIRKLQNDLAHVDAAISAMRPDYIAPRVNHSAISRQVFALLRNTKQPLTAGEIADLAYLGLNQVEVALKFQKRKGLVRGTKSGKWMAWEMVRD